MLANRVQETTTSTGTGNLTLAGAAANSQTFNTAFGTSRPFYYFVIDDDNNAWEHGLGYLSSSTVLVRQSIISSSNGDAAVNFSAGTKSVFCHSGLNTGIGRPSLYPADTVIVSPHVSQSGLLNGLTITADRIYYMPFLIDFYQQIDALGTGMQTAAGSKCRFGIYSNIGNRPSDLIAQSADITPANTTYVEGLLTPIKLTPGWYWVAFVSDGADLIRAWDYRYVSDSLLGIDGSSFQTYGYMYAEESAPSWTTLPASAGSLNLVNNFWMPKIGARVV